MAGKSQWEHFLSTPGARSSDAIYNMARQTGKTALTKAWNDMTQNEPDANDLDDRTALEAGLADLAADLDSHFKAFDGQSSLDVCSLVGPETLTVHVAGRGYRKEAHVGGEDFIPFEAYMGKKGKILVKFKPKQAAGYEHMEMTTDDALKSLSAFEALTMMEHGSFTERHAQLSKERSKLREQERNRNKFEDYASFGSF